jgi:hypothetical protein
MDKVQYPLSLSVCLRQERTPPRLDDDISQASFGYTWLSSTGNSTHTWFGLIPGTHPIPAITRPIPAFCLDPRPTPLRELQ